MKQPPGYPGGRLPNLHGCGGETEGEGYNLIFHEDLSLPGRVK